MGMSKEKVPFEGLKDFLPEGSFELVMPLIIQHKVHLTITKERQTKLGDYRNAYAGKNHRISVNGNLNKFSFLITLLHELAHLLAFEKHGNRIPPHGKEWKTTYAQVLHSFLQHHIFPKDIAAELWATLHNPGASTCAEEGLQRILLRYDVRKAGVKLVEQLPAGKLFKTTDGRVFKKGEQLRKRYKCTETATGKHYLFSGIYEVMEV
jgi:SprT protein